MDDAVRSGIRVTLLGMAASGVLATVKLVAGLVGHSYALVADAVESFADNQSAGEGREGTQALVKTLERLANQPQA